MFVRIVRHEGRLLAADGSLWMIVAVFAIAIGYGTFNGARWVTTQRATIDEATTEERERFATHEATIAQLSAGTLKLSAFADPRNPQTAASRFGARYAVMPPGPLAALSIGQSDLLPSYFKVTSDTRENVTATTEIENPYRLLTGRFDLAFVLVYLYPLLILAVSYNILSSEKEQGTLAMVLSQPVSLRTLALAKLALRALVLLLVLTVLAGIAMAVAGIQMTSGDLPALAFLWFGAVVAYGIVWFALAAFATSFGRPSSTNAMALATAWLGFVMMVPSMLNMVLTTVYPVPSRVQMIQAVREASDEANERGSTLLARYYDDHPELAAGGADQAMNDFNVIRVAVNAEVEARVRPVMARYEQQLASQRDMVGRLRILSPAILMQEALNDISGTGMSRHQHFLRQVGAYHDAWRAYFVPLIFRKAQIERYDTLPAFAFDDESLAMMASRVVASVGLMLVSATLLGGAAWWRLRRMSTV